MEPGIVAIVIAALIVGGILGVFIERIRTKRLKTQGTIYAYYGDQGDKPSLLLEYNVPIEDIASRKRVLFNVSVICRNSQK